MTETRRTFLKKLGMLGALAVVSPTGVIEAIVPKPKEDWVDLAGRSMKETVDANILRSIKDQAIVEKFVKYCHSRPPGDVGHSVCGVEILKDDKILGLLLRGLSMGADKKSMKYWNCMLHPQAVYSDEFIEGWAKDALVQLRIAWRHSKKRWGVAPRTMTQKEAHKLVYRAA